VEKVDGWEEKGEGRVSVCIDDEGGRGNKRSGVERLGVTG
jgi:hypothetical protein